MIAGRSQFAEALVWGSDRTDRFQTLARWRGEPRPGSSSAIGEEAVLPDQAAARMVDLDVSRGRAGQGTTRLFI